jgi:8-oxo-dGTP pyrophosphatase MutT (NUDIX family)
VQTAIAQHPANNPSKVVAKVDIPTATAIIYKKSDPNKVLVGHSQKHSAPVLPGGKIDLQDLVATSMEMVARHCIIRELQEEVGLTGVEPRFFKIHSDCESDNRVITVGSLKGTLIEDGVKGFGEEQLVLGRYGVPDYIFLVEIEADPLQESEELRKLEWVDVREARLGGGHTHTISMYRNRETV